MWSWIWPALCTKDLCLKKSSFSGMNLLLWVESGSLSVRILCSEQTIHMNLFLGAQIILLALSKRFIIQVPFFCSKCETFTFCLGYTFFWYIKPCGWCIWLALSMNFLLWANESCVEKESWSEQKIHTPMTIVLWVSCECFTWCANLLHNTLSHSAKRNMADSIPSFPPIQSMNLHSKLVKSSFHSD